MRRRTENALVPERGRSGCHAIAKNPAETA
jgi:hypothetical protein